MALKTLIHFPFFTPPTQPHHHGHRTSTVIRFSRWNNANAEKFNREKRTQKQIEDELRFRKRFDSADSIVNNYHEAASTTSTTTIENENFRSIGTPSTPSPPSIPGKKSKYSRVPRNPINPRPSPPAFNPSFQLKKLPDESKKSNYSENPINPNSSHPAFNPIFRLRKLPNEAEKAETGINFGDKGVSYVIPDAPFEFQYSYTETPKAKPLKLREPAIAPFGPDTIPRPWTGCKPIPPSKKKIDFDSFRLPPPHKKGVKPVQAPGPFLPGSGPKYVQSREEILGEPLTKEEINDLVKSCLKSERQLNMGRDGLTHNMLNNIHAHWKRRRVCKIKCRGVCTVDMDNVRQQLEEKTGGKIIYGKGGVLYLFRGRNYNYKTRPRFPLMLWKPITPVYPRLVKRVPEGLTLEEASEMRKKGRELKPICKLGKNGVYSDLAKNVREAFEACELVRIDCKGMNPSDYRRIGAKLKDLVPCVLISFEHEHILMWRGSDWKSSLPMLEEEELKKSESSATSVEGHAISKLHLPSMSTERAMPEPLENIDTNPSLIDGDDVSTEGSNNLEEDVDVDPLSGLDDMPTPRVLAAATSVGECNDSEPLIKSSEEPLGGIDLNAADLCMTAKTKESEVIQEGIGNPENQSDHVSVVPQCQIEMQYVSSNLCGLQGTATTNCPWMEGVIMLRNQAIDDGRAVVLEESSLDADIVFDRAVTLAKSAPSGPVFKRRPKMVAVEKSESVRPKKVAVEESENDMQEIRNLEVKQVLRSTRSGNDKKSSRNQRNKNLKDDYLDVVPQGALRVDELAKLLA